MSGSYPGLDALLQGPVARLEQGHVASGGVLGEDFHREALRCHADRAGVARVGRHWVLANKENMSALGAQGGQTGLLLVRAWIELSGSSRPGLVVDELLQFRLQSLDGGRVLFRRCVLLFLQVRDTDTHKGPRTDTQTDTHTDPGIGRNETDMDLKIIWQCRKRSG